MSNHVAALDDPLMVAACLPWGSVLHSASLRWVLCATDRCFNQGAALASFFHAAKVLPARGPGEPWMAVRERGMWGGNGPWK